MAKKVFTDESLAILIDEIKGYTDTSSAERATKGHGIYYGTCATAAATAAKVATLTDATGFSLTTGAVVIVKFTNANSASSPTLNVNSTGAKPIMRYGTTAASTSSSTSGWVAGAVSIFVYDGTNWVRDYWNNSTYSNVALGQGYATCSTAESTIAKVGTLSSYALSTGGIVAVKFTYAVPASATLNINSKGAKNIYHRGAAITAGVIKAGDIATFMYDGSQYHLLTVDRMEDESNQIVVDSEFSDSSTNPVQNQVITNKLQEIDNKLDFLDLGGTATYNATDNTLVIEGANITQSHYQQFLQNNNIPLKIGQYIFYCQAVMEWGASMFAQYSCLIYFNNNIINLSVSISWGETECSMSATTASKAPRAITAGAKSGTTIGTNATAEGMSTTASASYAHAEGMSTTASGMAAHAEGSSTTASGQYSHAEGINTTATANYAHAEGSGTTASGIVSHAEGYSTTASGNYAHAAGSNTAASGESSHAEGYSTTASGNYAHAAGYGTIANDYQYVVGMYNADTTAPTSLKDTTATAGLFIVGIGTSNVARSNGFRINPAGKVYGTGTFGTSGADYAEYFEWLDGNPNNEDRRGRFVTLDGDKIRYATANDDYILGVVSADPSVAGDVYSEDWHNRYLKDIFGSKIVDVVEVEETTNEDGEIIPAHTEKQWVLNPNYNPDLKYTSREERPEWAAIGLVGKLVVVDDGTCQVNGYCYPNDNGIAAASQVKTNYRVMERLDETHIRIFIR